MMMMMKKKTKTEAKRRKKKMLAISRSEPEKLNLRLVSRFGSLIEVGLQMGNQKTKNQKR